MKTYMCLKESDFKGVKFLGKIAMHAFKIIIILSLSLHRMAFMKVHEEIVFEIFISNENKSFL